MLQFSNLSWTSVNYCILEILSKSVFKKWHCKSQKSSPEIYNVYHNKLISLYISWSGSVLILGFPTKLDLIFFLEQVKKEDLENFNSIRSNLGAGATVSDLLLNAFTNCHSIVFISCINMPNHVYWYSLDLFLSRCGDCLG